MTVTILATYDPETHTLIGGHPISAWIGAALVTWACFALAKKFL
ncbi:hypothetical protein FHT44_005048 [Mycolicibacterium sp. BK634]|nr:hypothetical protein [Mycolicibacterium sp. BK634]MBB3752536.1 hypothetical protein [Mycolicibacterium sp. BK634]